MKYRLSKEFLPGGLQPREHAPNCPSLDDPIPSGLQRQFDKQRIAKGLLPITVTFEMLAQNAKATMAKIDSWSLVARRIANEHGYFAGKEAEKKFQAGNKALKQKITSRVKFNPEDLGL